MFYIHAFFFLFDDLQCDAHRLVAAADGASGLKIEHFVAGKHIAVARMIVFQDKLFVDSQCSDHLHVVYQLSVIQFGFGHAAALIAHKGCQQVAFGQRGVGAS